MIRLGIIYFLGVRGIFTGQCTVQRTRIFVGAYGGGDTDGRGINIKVSSWEDLFKFSYRYKTDGTSNKHFVCY